MQNFPSQVSSANRILDGSAFKSMSQSISLPSTNSLDFSSLVQSSIDYAEYNPQSTPGVPTGFATISDSNNLVRQDELKYIEDQLREKEISEEAIERYRKRLEQNNEVTVGRLIAASRSKETRLSQGLSEQDDLVFSSMLQRMGFNNEEISTMRELSAKGDGRAIMQKITAQLEKTSETFDLTVEESAVLTKAMDLSDKTRGFIASQFGNEAQLEVNSKGFANLYSSANSELDSEAAEDAKIQQILKEAIDKALAQGKRDNVSAADDNNRTSNQAQRKETMMRYTATTNGEGVKREDSLQAHITNNMGYVAQDKQEMNELEDANLKEWKDFQEKFDRDSQMNSKNNSSNNKGEAFSLADKNQTNSAQAPTDASSFASKITVLPSMNPVYGVGQAQVIQQVKDLSHHQRIFNQVEQGILKNAMDGSRQITLRLDPPDLGKLTLSLTVNNGEVKALIRTEQTEVTQLINEQLARIRSSLEDQGFKVTSLDVETKTSDSGDMSDWNSAEQHNLEQQMAEHARSFRLNKGISDQGDNLAQNMQGDIQQANLANSGIHIIA